MRRVEDARGGERAGSARPPAKPSSDRQRIVPKKTKIMRRPLDPAAPHTSLRFSHALGRRIAEDELALDGGYVIVSTMDTLDMGLETAIHCRVGGVPRTKVVNRYADEPAACAGHDDVIRELRGGRRRWHDPGWKGGLGAMDFQLDALPRRAA